jgi:tetratricopeptide (TPR) repeat protein
MTESLSYLVDMLMRQKKFYEAEALLNEFLSPAVIDQPQSLSPLLVRTEFFARRGRWIEAAADASRAVDSQPDEHGYYHMLAPLLIATKDLNRYQELCREMITRFGSTTDAYVADRMAKDCLVLPSIRADLQTLARMTEVAVTRGATTLELPAFQFCKALAEYRQGHFMEAVGLAEQTVKYPNPYPEAGAYAVMAMAKYRLKQTDGARVALAKVAGIIDTKMRKIENGDLGSGWRDWIIVHTLFAEANSVIQNAATAESNKN